MDESNDAEELAPLFDYSCIHSANLICLSDDELDDSHSDSNVIRKRKSGHMKENAELLIDEGEEVKGNTKKDEEEDWLPPPPKLPCIISSAGLEDNKTLQALRSTKEELASLAEAANDLLNSPLRLEKSGVCISEKSATEAKGDGFCEKVEREKVVISVQDKNGQQLQFRLFMDDKFQRLFKIYAEKVKFNLENLAFSFDGEQVSPTATPAGLGMENDDIIEVHLKS